MSNPATQQPPEATTTTNKGLNVTIPSESIGEDSNLAYALLGGFKQLDSQNEKGKAEILKLLKSPATLNKADTVARRLSKNEETDLHKNRLLVMQAITAAINHYRSGFSVNKSELATLINPEGAGRRFGYENIIPLLVDIGLLVNDGERSTYWQLADQINPKPDYKGMVREFFALSDDLKALKEEQRKAQIEAAKLRATERREQTIKRRVLANNRAESLAQEANSSEPTSSKGLLVDLRDNWQGASLLAAFGVLAVVAMFNAGSNGSDMGNAMIDKAQQQARFSGWEE